MIRKATMGDIDNIEAIYNRIHDEEEAGRMTIGWNRKIYPVRQTAIDAVNRDDLFVQEIDDKIVAAAIINQVQVPEYAECEWEYNAAEEEEEIMVLHTLVVDPQVNGRGYGKAFVKYYEEYAVEHGCNYLRMDTNVKNANARQLYAKLGYKEPGIVSCVFNGIPDVKLVCLEKKL